MNKKYSEEICRLLFEVNMKLIKSHPFYDEFKDELKSVLDKCSSHKNKF